MDGARLLYVIKRIPKRTQIVALQEVRTLRGPSWASIAGYMVMFPDRQAKESGVAIAMWNDMLKKFKAHSKYAEKHYIELELHDGQAQMRVVYIPPEGSRNYSGDDTERKFEKARAPTM